jgi:hypothetical protein
LIDGVDDEEEEDEKAKEEVRRGENATKRDVVEEVQESNLRRNIAAA